LAITSSTTTTIIEHQQQQQQQKQQVSENEALEPSHTALTYIQLIYICLADRHKQATHTHF
jgi:hypothetical protein